MFFYIIFLCAKAQEICIVHQIMLTKKRHRGYFLEAGVMKPLKFRDWINLREQGSNNSTRAAKRRAKWFQRLLQHGKLSWQREIDWSKQYLYQYLCFVPHDIRWFVLSMVMNNIKVIIPTGYRK